MKGHLSNVFDELPYLLEKSLAEDVTAVFNVHVHMKETKQGGDFHLAAINVLALLRKQESTPVQVLKLIETAVDISELLYADEVKRSPKTILRLYNATWLHFELCVELLISTRTMTHRKMFGIYLHAIVHHAPQQFEIIKLNLKSTNTEHEERLFGQAKDMVHKATNKQPQNVIHNILLRLQVKQMRGDMYTSYHSMLSRVSKAVHELEGDGSNSTVTKSFLTGRMSSWQEHLKCISPFLRLGCGIWWKSTEEGYEFFDGKKEPHFRIEGPQLLHFRNTNLKDIHNMKSTLWQEICEEDIVLPTPYIKVYSPHGEYRGTKIFDELHVHVSSRLSLIWMGA